MKHKRVDGTSVRPSLVLIDELAARVDVADIVRMLADDALGAKRES